MITTFFSFIQVILLTGFFAVVGVQNTMAQTNDGIVALYTFDHRAPAGKVVKPMHQTIHPYHGDDYIPHYNQGEIGPVLINLGSGGVNPNYHRSFFNNASSESADGRQVLELRQHHVYYLDTFQTPSQQGPLPSEGSFTWELLVRIDAFDGTNHFGMLIDASKGAGRLVNYPGKGTNRGINTRLWLRPHQDDNNALRLNFTVPTDDENHGKTITATLNKGQWYHLAAVYDDFAHEARIFVDGELVATKPVTAYGNRSTGFGLAGAFSPDVFRVDHPLRLQKAMIDAIAMTRDVRTPENFVLWKTREVSNLVEHDKTDSKKSRIDPK